MVPRSQNGQGDHVIWSEDVHIVGLYSVIVIGECRKTFKGCCIVQYSNFCQRPNPSYHIICLVWRVTESSFDVSSIVLSTKSITTNFKSVLYFVWYPRLYLDFFIFLFNDVWRCDVKWNEMKWNEINSIEINSIEKAIILENIVLCEIFLRRMLSLT